MYLLTDTALVTSASDLTLASDCEFGFLRVLDHRLKWSTDPSISRAKWAAYLLFTPALLDSLPQTAKGVATLSRFIWLTEDAGIRT